MLGNKNEMTPLEYSRKREKDLIKGLYDLAEKFGKRLEPIYHIDANGEVMFVIQAEDQERRNRGVCGEFGEEIASLLNQINVRCGTITTKGHVLPENGWVRINHFEVEKLLKLADSPDNQDNQDNQDSGLRP